MTYWIKGIEVHSNYNFSSLEPSNVVTSIVTDLISVFDVPKTESTTLV